eukprot:3540976-Prymnesium_polylepis.1
MRCNMWCNMRVQKIGGRARQGRHAQGCARQHLTAGPSNCCPLRRRRTLRSPPRPRGRTRSHCRHRQACRSELRARRRH